MLAATMGVAAAGSDPRQVFLARAGMAESGGAGEGEEAGTGGRVFISRPTFRVGPAFPADEEEVLADLLVAVGG